MKNVFIYLFYIKSEEVAMLCHHVSTVAQGMDLLTLHLAYEGYEVKCDNRENRD